MFQAITLRGAAASILWSYHTAAELRSWRIRKHEGQWRLSGTLTRVEPFQIRQKPLLFTAPRVGGFWCWGIESIEIVGLRLQARLGPPEQ